jgi:ferredoxin-type protein NapG
VRLLSLRTMMERKGISRRDFLQIWRYSNRARAAVTSNLPRSSHADTGNTPSLKVSLQPLPFTASASGLSLPSILLRPPGAIDEEIFQKRCQSCGNCIEACPVQAIYPAPAETKEWTPVIDPAISPCVLCAELKCTQVCPSDALQPLSTPNEVCIGTAVIDTARCTAWRGLPCRICYDVCPISGVIQLEIGERTLVPVAGETPCVGCGVCIHHCPAEGAILIIPFDKEHDGRVQVKACQSGKNAS